MPVPTTHCTLSPHLPPIRSDCVNTDASVAVPIPAEFTKPAGTVGRCPVVVVTWARRATALTRCAHHVPVAILFSARR